MKSQRLEEVTDDFTEKTAQAIIYGANDVNVFVSLSDVANRDFIYSYSATNTAMYDGVSEQSRASSQAVTLLMEETDDLHVLCETIHFSDEYTGGRTYVQNQLTEHGWTRKRWA